MKCVLSNAFSFPSGEIILVACDKGCRIFKTCYTKCIKQEQQLSAVSTAIQPIISFGNRIALCSQSKAASNTFPVRANSVPAMQRSEEVPLAVAAILPFSADNTTRTHYSS